VTPTLAITGSTGNVGGRIARLLAARGIDQRLIVRDAARAPQVAGDVRLAAGYSDTEAMRAALEGIDTLFLVSGREQANRVAEHRAGIDAAVAAGVQRIVYLSFFGAAPDCTFTFGRDHWHTEQAIRETGLSFTFLRDNWYQQVFPYMVNPDGAIRGPAGDGRAAAVSIDDIADVAVEVLTGTGHEGQAYRLTGPEDLSLAEVAAQLSAVTGRDVRYEEETIEEAYASRAGYGAPQFEVDGWVTTYVAIADGELSGPTDDVERLAGHRPQSFTEMLAANPDSYAHLMPPAAESALS
jgi:uncharacterized protein YbjT (DUF2867 family)